MVIVMLYPCIFVLFCYCIYLSCVFDSVCEIVGETIRNIFGSGCYFVVECYGCV